MTNTTDYTNEEYLNSKNKKEISNVNSIGENIIHDENLVPNGLGNNTLYQVGNQLKRPEIVNDNNVNNIVNNNIIVNKEQIPIVEKKENIQMVIEDIEPTEVTKELKNLSNKSNSHKLNNHKLNNHKLNNNNSNIMIILKELKQIFPLSVIIAIVVFIFIFIYIVRF